RERRMLSTVGFMRMTPNRLLVNSRNYTSHMMKKQAFIHNALSSLQGRCIVLCERHMYPCKVFAYFCTSAITIVKTLVRGEDAVPLSRAYLAAMPCLRWR